jgi:choline dehydrogenase-like flavoprotein
MSRKKRTYDAIVIGSGISGGWAAKELCEKGLRTLVLERGRDVRHIADYNTANLNPWELDHRGARPTADTAANPVVNRCYAFNEATQHFFVKDREHPYVQEKPFDWIRGYQTGGKSLLWARQVQRWSELDFEGPARDGFAVDWPIRYTDLAPWYSYVERFAGISGNADGLAQLPDGEFLPPMELNAAEKHLQARFAAHYPDRKMIVARCAHLTQPQPQHLAVGRGQCQYRDLCYRGCPFGAYFSSNSATLPAATRTKKMRLVPNSVVDSIIYDEKKGRATGVRVIDSATKEYTEYFARIIFVNAGCLNTNLLLLNSISARFPSGLGNDNGLLGKYVAFHNYRASVSATVEGLEDRYYFGRRPTSGYIARFRNLYRQETDFLRGYAVGVACYRQNWSREEPGFGAELKEKLTEPGPWAVRAWAMGETLPKESSQVRLDTNSLDEWGIPQLRISVDYDDNDERMIRDFHTEAAAMLDWAGCRDIQTHDTHQAPGLDIHEMGGCRMGRDPRTSLLNGWNQLHACPNVFVTDGAAMTSTATQNPSLTFMALTARAADHAVSELKRRNI